MGLLKGFLPAHSHDPFTVSDRETSLRTAPSNRIFMDSGVH